MTGGAATLQQHFEKDVLTKSISFFVIIFY